MLIRTHRFPKLAIRDITVYKILHPRMNCPSKYETICMGIPVEPNSILTNKCSIFGGIINKYIQKEGVHAYRHYPREHLLFESCIVVKAIIPKGTWYYEGLCDEIASSKLRFEDLTPLQSTTLP